MARGDTKARNEVKAEVVVDLPADVEAPVVQHELSEGDLAKADEILNGIVGQLAQLEEDLASGTVTDEDGKAQKHLDAIIATLEAMIAKGGTAHKKFGWIKAILDKATAAKARQAAKDKRDAEKAAKALAAQAAKAAAPKKAAPTAK